MSYEADLLEDLVSIPSYSGYTDEIVTFLKNEIESWKMEVLIDRGALIVNPEASEILLLGHVDTVPGNISVKRDEGLIWGRGSVDAKGPLCAALLALRSRPDLWDRVKLIAVPDEEGRSKTARWIREELKPVPCVILEPGNWQGITISYNGRTLLELSVKADSSHSGSTTPFASEILHDGIMEIRKRTGARLTRMSGNITEASADFDIRFQNRPEIEEIDERIKLKVLDEIPSIRSEKNSKIVRSFLSSIRKNGGKPVFKRKTGTSDMNVLGQKWEVPMIAYGPGDSALDHTEKEHISIDEFERSIKVWSLFFNDYFP